MSAASEGKKVRVGGPSDVYTALMGLAVLALAATTAVVCVYGQRMFETFVNITKGP